MFSTLSEGEINISATFILTSADAFNLDQSKILSFGKELRLVYEYKHSFSCFTDTCDNDLNHAMTE